jgi:hypothetical protein
VRLPSDATDQVRAYILTRFSRFVERRGKTRFMEKTPSNCFRIPFIQEVFPDGKFLHLIRDGRDATFSAEKKWMSRLDHTAFRRRVLSREIPLADLPNYSAAILRDTVGRMVMPQAGFIWGPRFPRIREIRASRSVLETCAIQWRESVRAVLAARQQLPEAQYMELRFEDLVCRPDEWISTILEFLELEVDGRVQEFAARCVRSSVANKWRKRSHEEVEGFLPLIVDLLRDLGYAD